MVLDRCASSWCRIVHVKQSVALWLEGWREPELVIEPAYEKLVASFPAELAARS